jgi:hypothetical protein
MIGREDDVKYWHFIQNFRHVSCVGGFSEYYMVQCSLVCVRVSVLGVWRRR